MFRNSVTNAKNVFEKPIKLYTHPAAVFKGKVFVLARNINNYNLNCLYEGYVGNNKKKSI